MDGGSRSGPVTPRNAACRRTPTWSSGGCGLNVRVLSIKSREPVKDLHKRLLIIRNGANDAGTSSRASWSQTDFIENKYFCHFLFLLFRNLCVDDIQQCCTHVNLRMHGIHSRQDSRHKLRFSIDLNEFLAYKNFKIGKNKWQT